MQASKPSMRTRKVVNYAAMNGDVSDDSEDDIVNCVNIKVAAPTAPTTKPSKVSKLKLGTRKESKLLKDDAAKVTNSKPILDHVAPMKLSVTSPPCLTSNMEDNELSIAEPDLITHSIFSQETVITSTCECLSPHEFTDSSESETYSSTVEITSAKESAQQNTKPDPLSLKTSEDRIIKRRIISESLSTQKKIKIDVEDRKNQNTSPVDEPSITKHAVDVSAVPPQLQTLPCSLLGTDKSSLEHSLSPHQHLAGPFTSHDEVSIFQEGSILSPDPVHQPTNQSMKEDHSSEIGYAPRGLTLNVITISEKSVPIVNFPTPAMLTPKSTKRTEDEPKRKAQTKNVVASLKLKNDSPNSMESGARPRPPTTVISGPNAIAYLSAIGVIKEVIRPRDVASLPYPVNILKPPSPQASPLSRKPAVKWKPPGKAGGSHTVLGSNSPVIGIRLGLSRNRRTNKPLHPDVKVKL